MDYIVAAGSQCHHDISTPQVAVAQRPECDRTSAAEKGEHALPLYADLYRLPFEQQIAGLGEGYSVVKSEIHAGKMVWKDSSAAARSGRQAR